MIVCYYTVEELFIWLFSVEANMETLLDTSENVFNNGAIRVIGE